MVQAEESVTILCEWCGSQVPLEDAVDYKPRNHPLTVCPDCLPGEDTPFGGDDAV